MESAVSQKDKNRCTILFLHGGALNSAMWAPQLDALFTEFNTLAMLAQYTGPAILINGEHDKLNRKYEPQLAACGSRIECLRIQNAGHLCNLQQPEHFNQAVRNFAIQVCGDKG